MRNRQQRAASRLLEKWRNDPVAYAWDVHGIRCWDKQAEILYSVARNKRTAVKAGQKVSKSHSDALVALWWVMTRPRGKVLITAPSAHQIRDIIWPELQQMIETARFPIGATPSVDPSTGFRFARGRRIWGKSTNDPGKLQGPSGDELLEIVDEASAFRQDMWAPIEGNLAGGGRLLATSNPNNPSGTFYEAFGRSSELWSTISIASTDSPNYKENRIVVPGLATREYVDQMKVMWGEDSAAYKVRILGQFPESGDDQVISVNLVERGQTAQREMLSAAKVAAKEDPERNEDPNRDRGNRSRLELGVDVARFGNDESVVQPKRGRWMPEPVARHGLDTEQVAELVLQTALEFRRDNERVWVKVDGIGIGAGVVDKLRRIEWLTVVDIQAGARAADEDRFVLLRDQLWWSIRDYVEDGGSLPQDIKLVGELTAPTYKTDTLGRIKVASKDEIKKILGRSPDRADAVALAAFNYGGGPLVTPPTRPAQPRSRWAGVPGRGF